MRKNVLLILTFLAVLTIQAQKLSYAYDAAGNRVSRTIVVGTRSADASTQPTDLQFFEETLAERQVKIYPHFQSAELTIAVPDYDVSLQGVCTVYNEDGVMLERKNITAETTHINLVDYPLGVNTLHITLGGKNSAWKIITL